MVYYQGSNWSHHYTDVIMGAMASQITSLTIVYSTVYSEADQRKYQSSAALAFVRGIHRGPANSPYKWPVTRKKFPFDNVIMPPYTIRQFLGINYATSHGLNLWFPRLLTLYGFILATMVWCRLGLIKHCQFSLKYCQWRPLTAKTIGIILIGHRSNRKVFCFDV